MHENLELPRSRSYTICDFIGVMIKLYTHISIKHARAYDKPTYYYNRLPLIELLDNFYARAIGMDDGAGLPTLSLPECHALKSLAFISYHFSNYLLVSFVKKKIYARETYFNNKPNNISNS